jgi:hypothetical protein
LEIAAQALAARSSCSKDLTLSRRPLLSMIGVEDSPAVEVSAGALESWRRGKRCELKYCTRVILQATEQSVLPSVAHKQKSCTRRFQTRCI